MDHGFVAGYEFFLRSALGCSDLAVDVQYGYRSINRITGFGYDSQT